MHYLYKITNSLDSKVYIGQSVDPNRRWSFHKNKSKKEVFNQYIHRAMNKYGINNFTFEIIAVCLTQEYANEIEDQLIDQYNSRDDQFGYNLKPGGNVRGKWNHSEESKKKMSENWYRSIDSLQQLSKSKKGKSISSKGKKLSIEHRQALSKSHIGITHKGNRKFRHSEETKRKMREAKRKKSNTDSN